MTLLEKHIHLVEDVNNSKTREENHTAEMRLDGFRIALEEQGINQLTACDMHYIDKGISRPMCCGVFLGWAPSGVANNDPMSIDYTKACHWDGAPEGTTHRLLYSDIGWHWEKHDNGYLSKWDGEYWALLMPLPVPHTEKRIARPKT